MPPNKIKALWKEGKPATARWLQTGDPYIAEAMANAGYDAIIIDMEHGMAVTPDRAVACLQAISTTDTVPLVRVAWNYPREIQFVLDAGAYGVIVPLVNTYDEAVQTAGASRYPPIGYRSLGPNRVSFYAGADYFQHANEEIIVLVMIETVQAVDNLEEIAKAPGIDGFYIGPFRSGRLHGYSTWANCRCRPATRCCQPTGSGCCQCLRTSAMPPRRSGTGRGGPPFRPGFQDVLARQRRGHGQGRSYSSVEDRFRRLTDAMGLGNSSPVATERFGITGACGNVRCLGYIIGPMPKLPLGLQYPWHYAFQWSITL